ncbi:MAG: hypothetical protein V9E88_01075 [Ferruginibacter sp.]
MKKRNSAKLIRSNHIVVCGEITGVGYNRSGHIIHFEYYVKGKLFKNSCDGTYKTKSRFERGKRIMLVVVQSDNYANSRLLQDFDDYIRFDIIPKDTSGLSCK